MTIHLNDIAISGFSIIGLRVGDTYYREAAKSGTFVAYQNEGYQVTKAGAREIKVYGVFLTETFAELQDGINALTEVLGSEGTKSVEANDVYYEVFNKDGFKVSQLIIRDQVTAAVEIPLVQVGQEVVDPDWLLDVDGEYVLDFEGKRILDLA